MTQMLTGAGRWTAPQTGEYRVAQGRVWITRDGDTQDHVLADGECLAVRQGEVLVVEPWTPGQGVRWSFERSRPAVTPLRLAAWVAGGLVSVAAALREWALRLDPELLAD